MAHTIYALWAEGVGDTEDALTLLDYFADQNKACYEVEDIFEAIGLSPALLGTGKLKEDQELHFTNHLSGKPIRQDFYFAIDVVGLLGALLLESLTAADGLVDLHLLDNGYPTFRPKKLVAFRASHTTLRAICNELQLFCQDPESYDLADLTPTETIHEFVAQCQIIQNGLRKYCDE